jgi:hypothetical protein
VLILLEDIKLVLVAIFLVILPISQIMALTNNMRVNVNWEDMEWNSWVSSTIPAFLLGMKSVRIIIAPHGISNKVPHK